MSQESIPPMRWLTSLGVITCVCLGILVFSGIVAPPQVIGGADSLTVLIHHAGSLRPGSEISFQGVPVGTIESLELLRADGDRIAQAQSVASSTKQTPPPRVRVVGSLQRGIRSLITDDSVLEIRSDAHHQSSLDIQPGNGIPIATDGILRMQNNPTNDTDLEHLRTLSSLRQTAEAMTKLFELLTGDEGLNNMIRTIGDAGHSVRDSAEEFRILIRDGRAPILSSMQQAEEILIELRAHCESLPELMDSISRAGKQGEDLLLSVDQLLHENRAPFRATIENLQFTSENLHQLAAELRRRPWRILNAPGDRESAFIALHECANRYADGALEVRRATEQVRDLLDRRGEDRDILEKLEDALQVLGDRLTRQADLEKTLLERTQDLAVPH
ncbi:MAG: MlaD family protein [Planctomycetota bacterium]